MSISAQSTTGSGPEIRRIREGYWRVSGAAGAVLGYVEETTDAGGPRYRAKRLYSTGRVGEIGDFSRQQDAVECFR